MAVPRSSPSYLLRPVLVATVMAVTLAACDRARPGPRFTVEWVASDSGHGGTFDAPATARWCAVAERLEVQAIRDDRAFGLVVYPESVLVPGEYAVFDPGVDTVHRPSAVAAARWFTDQSVAGFQSDSGVVEILEAGPTVRMRFGLRLRSLTGQDTLRAEGQAVRLAPEGCPADSVPTSAPAQ